LLTVTGLVFDLPHAPWMGDVMRLRAIYDRVRLGFPIEITVVGSSGLGWFSPSVEHETLVHKVREAARGFAPFSFRFGTVNCFPGSNVYYLQPVEEMQFRTFQARIAASGLSFEPIPYDYVPHCTIAEVSETRGTNAREELLQCPVPDHEIPITSVSFYTVDRQTQRCYQHERVALGV
jgi:2'-5' RNA ligase